MFVNMRRNVSSVFSDISRKPSFVRWSTRFNSELFQLQRRDLCLVKVASRTIRKPKLASFTNTSKFSMAVDSHLKYSIPKSSKMSAVLLSEFGGPEVLNWGETELPEGPKPGQVMIQSVAAGINRAELLQRKGAYPPVAGESEILGLEVSGFIVKNGAGCSKFEVGDRVMALLPGGGNAEYVTVNEAYCIKLPQELDFVNAAAIPETWLTAYQLIHMVAKGFVEKVAKRDESSAVVHAGASGVGVALIQLLKLLGVKVYVTAGSQEKADFCVSLGADGGINYKEHGRWEEKLSEFEPKGVDIIFDSVGGSYLAQNLKSLKTDGYYVLYGLLGGSSMEGTNLGTILRKRLNIFGSTLKTRSPEYKAELVGRFDRETASHFANGRLRPVVYKQFPVEKIREAHELMESNTNMGKIVLTMPLYHS